LVIFQKIFLKVSNSLGLSCKQAEQEAGIPRRTSIERGHSQH